MRTPIIIFSTVWVLDYAFSSEISFFNSKYAHGRKYKYRINNVESLKQPPPSSSPIQYLETPNFDIMFLTEENSNPTWRKYSQLFQPKDMSTLPHIEVNYGNYENFPYPFINLDRSDIEAILASLGDKKHIFVFHPRNCKPHSKTLDEFENEFLPKLFQNLHRPPSSTTTTSATYNLDPVVARILAMLDKDEQKMLDSLRKTFEKPTYIDVNFLNRRRNSRPKIVDKQNEVSSSKNRKHLEQKTQLRDLLYNVPCNEGYVFLVESRKNPLNPNGLSDLLLRTMKIVTKMS